MYYSQGSFTDSLQTALRDIGWCYKKLTFYYRQENGKRKKVTGKFMYVTHRPKAQRHRDSGYGFIIWLKDVHYMGRYYGRKLGFYTKQIEWTEGGIADAFSEAMKMATRRLERGEQCYSNGS